MAKQNGISGKRALAQALVWRMAKDREEGLASKKNKFVQDNEKNIDLRCDFRFFSIVASLHGNLPSTTYTVSRMCPPAIVVPGDVFHTSVEAAITLVHFLV